MMGTISVEGYAIECIVGIHPHERTTPQTLIVDVELDWDFGAAARADDFQHTIDYCAVAELLRDLAIEREYQLIETFVEEGARAILDRWPTPRVALKAMKPDAVKEARHTAVRIERRR